MIVAQSRFKDWENYELRVSPKDFILNLCVNPIVSTFIANNLTG
jgi:hypothetical protein